MGRYIYYEINELVFFASEAAPTAFDDSYLSHISRAGCMQTESKLCC